MIKCGLVGWKNSGKTFVAQKLIHHFSKLNFKVASIKHAHHNFQIDQPGTDSFFHRQAGAQQIIISSSKRWAKIVEIRNESEKKLDDLLNEVDSADIVIIEGFKNSPHPKIEIVKENTKDYLFLKLKNIFGIISDKKINTSIPQFKFEDIENVANFILNKAK